MTNKSNVQTAASSPLPPASNSTSNNNNNNNSSTLIKCAGCERPILDQYLYNVLDRAWHQSCIQCFDCKLNLSEKCFSRDGKLFCKEDFFKYVL